MVSSVVPVRGKSWPRWDGRTLGGRHLLVRAGDDLAETALFARFVPLADLPRILGTTLDTIPAQGGYLRVPRSPRRELPAPVPGRIRIGIQWSTGAVEADARSPSCLLSQFLRLAERPDVDLVSLQAGAAQDIAEAGAGALVQEIEGIEDPAVFAAAIVSTDLVIAVDSPAVHVAGALGHPVWAVLPFAPEWWWMLGRDDSPWYPTAWLFRQRKPGEWAPVLRRVRAALDAALDAPREEPPVADPAA